MPTRQRRTRQDSGRAQATHAPVERTHRRRDVFQGNAAREESERVIADAKRRQEEAGKMPFRFYLNQGDEKSFIILDEEPTFTRWEHEEWDGRSKRMNYYGCISTTDNCPACESLEFRSYFAMYLTVIDLTPFTTKNGDNVEFSKKLLVVKQNQHKIFWRKYDKNKSLRGMLFDTFRDKKTDARIGGTLELQETLTEDELQEYVREYKDRDGNDQTDDVEPFDYYDLFPETTLESLEAAFGAAPAAGSSREVDQELNDQWEDDGEDGGDENPVRGHDNGAASRRRARSGEEVDGSRSRGSSSGTNRSRGSSSRTRRSAEPSSSTKSVRRRRG